MTNTTHTQTDDNDDDITFVPVKELRAGDRIPYGTVLGAVQAAEQLTVKTCTPAAHGRYAVNIYRVGTLFINGDMELPIRENPAHIPT